MTVKQARQRHPHLVPDDSISIDYNFKCFPSPEGGGFDYPPRLVREDVVVRYLITQDASAEMIFTPSTTDPWSDVEMVRTLGALYTKGHNTMHPGRVVAEVDSASYRASPAREPRLP